MIFMRRHRSAQKKFTAAQRSAERGSALLITLAAVMVVSISLAAVLTLSVQEHRMLARTADWNAALPAAEAGIEEAMSHLWQVDGGPRGVNGWAQEGANFVRSRTLPHGRFDVAVSSGTPPVITSTGQVWSVSTGDLVERRIQVRTRGQGIFPRGIVAKGKITLSGQFTSDSFDSSDPNYSTNGMYIVSRRKDNGDMATMAAPDAFDLGGQVKIYGHVSTTANGIVKISDPKQQVIGSASYIDSGGTGIEPGRHKKDLNVSFPNVEAPYSGGMPLSGGTINGVLYKYVLQSGEYTISTLTLSGSDKMLVLGGATLLVNQDVSISGDAFIQINPGANLQVYVRKGSVSISGKSVGNLTGYAANFGLWGMPEMKNINFSGEGEFLGTMYAPQAKLSMSGGSTSGLDFVGAAIVDEVNGSGQYRFHYDEALGSSNARNLGIVSWREI
jgi:Tfp pilus assembly protein PilX